METNADWARGVRGKLSGEGQRHQAVEMPRTMSVPQMMLGEYFQVLSQPTEDMLDVASTASLS